MVATVVASSPVAVAPASLGDLAVAGAAVNLKDVAGSRKRRETAARGVGGGACLLYTSPSPRDGLLSRMPSSA